MIDYDLGPRHWEESWGSEKGIWEHAKAVIARREKGRGRHWTNAERVHLKLWRQPDAGADAESGGGVDLYPFGCDISYHQRSKYMD